MMMTMDAIVITMIMAFATFHG